MTKGVEVELVFISTCSCYQACVGITVLLRLLPKLRYSSHALGTTYPGLHQYFVITPSQNCLDLEEKLYGSLEYVPECPRKLMVPTVQSLL